MTQASEPLSPSSSLAAEYKRLEQLIDYAAQGHDISRFGGHAVLYVNPDTHRIIDSNLYALSMTGYTRDQLVGLPLEDLEVPIGTDDTPRTYVENSVVEHVYMCSYRQRSGHLIPVEVHRRLLYKNEDRVLYYRIEDRSMVSRLWRELQRREDAGFQFQQRLKALNELTMELSRIDAQDALCYQTIKLGVERLGFDRMGMWFCNVENGEMVGSYGIDETGTIRPEHNQRWPFTDTFVTDFLAGRTEVVARYEEVPLFNDRSEVVEYGWHLAAPMQHGSELIGILTVDNLLRKQPMKNYEPELLRMYGITVGHLMQLRRVRDQAFAVRLEQARTGMLREFIAKVGHDFKTPLAVINTSSFLLQRLDDGEKRAAQSSRIQQQVRLISQMLDDILEFVALERELVLNYSLVDLRPLIQDVIDEHASAAADKTLQLEVQLDQTTIIRVDSQQIRRALSELLKNAIQYTPPGGRICVSAIRYPEEIGIRVQDSGMGISSLAIDKVFKPLYRADEARTDRRTGLGLPIAKTIVEAHHGRIILESMQGQGSTFEIILPQI
ncbi:MAG: PAS domain-containing sensor histidine kinase [Anaerolineae bacterium]|nr:PAS domain-containing sensor histidine kinase [Anaerolineae bacterium]